MPSAPRLYALLPRNGRKGVVFRRGPSKQVALIAWDLGRDKFVLGQWLKGRVYERRCDLSPSGDLLVYFAASWKRTPGSWTALSRPPYFTALALWPKGDTWGGGGMFDAERTLRLNHPAHQTTLGEGFRLPKDFRVLPLGDHAGRGEDGPLTDLRDARDGWSHLRAAVWQQPTAARASGTRPRAARFTSNGPLALRVGKASSSSAHSMAFTRPTGLGTCCGTRW